MPESESGRLPYWRRRTLCSSSAAFPPGFAQTHRRLLEKKIVAGLALEPYYPELRDHYLFCATETMPREDLDALVREVQP